jgi:hypothetical protein
VLGAVKVVQVIALKRLVEERQAQRQNHQQYDKDLSPQLASLLCH